METIVSGDRTQSLTQSPEHSTVNSSVRTTRSLESFFRANTGSVISEMAGNISRNTETTNASFNAFQKSRNSQITMRIVRDNEVTEFREDPQTVQQREEARKLFAKLQSERNVRDVDTNRILQELNASLPEAPYTLETLPILGVKNHTEQR